MSEFGPDPMQKIYDERNKMRSQQYGNGLFSVVADIANMATGGRVGGTDPWMEDPRGHMKGPDPRTVRPQLAPPPDQSSARYAQSSAPNPFRSASEDMDSLYPKQFPQEVATDNVANYRANQDELERQRAKIASNYAEAQQMMKAGQANLQPRPTGGFVNDTLWGAFKNRLPYETDPVTGQSKIQTPQTGGDLAGLIFSKLGNTLANVGGYTEFHKGKGNNVYRLTFDRANAQRMGEADRNRQVALDQTNPEMTRKRAVLMDAIQRDMANMTEGVGGRGGGRSSTRDTSMTEAQAFNAELAKRRDAREEKYMDYKMSQETGKEKQAPPTSIENYMEKLDVVLNDQSIPPDRREAEIASAKMMAEMYGGLYAQAYLNKMGAYQAKEKLKPQPSAAVKATAAEISNRGVEPNTALAIANERAASDMANSRNWTATDQWVNPNENALYRGINAATKPLAPLGAWARSLFGMPPYSGTEFAPSANATNAVQTEFNAVSEEVKNALRMAKDDVEREAIINSFANKYPTEKQRLAAKSVFRNLY